MKLYIRQDCKNIFIFDHPILSYSFLEINNLNKRFEKKLETIERHNQMDCRVFEIKIDQSRLNKNQKEFLNMTFLEAKWFYNHLLNKSKTEDIFKMNTKSNFVVS